MIRPFVRQHDEMIEIVNRILGLARGVDPRPDLIVLERLRFARAIQVHRRDEGVYLADAIARGRIDRATVTDFENGVVNRWWADLMRFNSEWSATRVARDPTGFAAAFRPLADVLRREARREEREVLGPASRAAPASNCTALR